MITISIVIVQYVSACLPPPAKQAAQKQLSSPSKESQMPEVLRHSGLNWSLNTSSAYETSSASFVNAGNEEPDAEEVERIRSIL